MIMRLICLRRRLRPRFICWPATWAERIVEAALVGREKEGILEPYLIDSEISAAEKDWLMQVLLAFVLGAVLGAFL